MKSKIQLLKLTPHLDESFTKNYLTTSLQSILSVKYKQGKYCHAQILGNPLRNPFINDHQINTAINAGAWHHLRCCRHRHDMGATVAFGSPWKFLAPFWFGTGWHSSNLVLLEKYKYWINDVMQLQSKQHKRYHAGFLHSLHLLFAWSHRSTSLLLIWKEAADSRWQHLRQLQSPIAKLWVLCIYSKVCNIFSWDT